MRPATTSSSVSSMCRYSTLVPTPRITVSSSAVRSRCSAVRRSGPWAMTLASMGS